MAIVIAAANQKGECSKTSVVANLGIGLALKGKKVCLIDADPQGSLTASLGYQEPDEIRYTLANIMMNIINEEEYDPKEGILHHEEGVDLVPANIELSGLEVSLSNVMSREMILKEYVEQIRIPKVMLTEESFSSLPIPAKVLYGVLLDRMTLSRKNGWFDEDNRVFIIYQIEEIREDLGFSKKKAMDLLSELESFGLLEKRRRGHGLPNILYVKSFMTGLDADVQAKEKSDARGSENGTSRANYIDPRSAEIITSRSAGLGTSKVSNSALQEVPISAPLKSNTEKNNNYRNNIESNPGKMASQQKENNGRYS